jgi:hypothetical protein
MPAREWATTPLSLSAPELARPRWLQQQGRVHARAGGGALICTRRDVSLVCVAQGRGWESSSLALPRDHNARQAELPVRRPRTVQRIQARKGRLRMEWNVCAMQFARKQLLQWRRAIGHLCADCTNYLVRSQHEPWPAYRTLADRRHARCDYWRAAAVGSASSKLFRSACRNLAYNDFVGPVPTGIKALTKLVHMCGTDSALMCTALRPRRLWPLFRPFRKGGITGRLGAGVMAGVCTLVRYYICAVEPVSRGCRSLLSNRFSGTVPVGISNLTALTTMYARAHLLGLQHRVPLRRVGLGGAAPVSRLATLGAQTGVCEECRDLACRTQSARHCAACGLQ